MKIRWVVRWLLLLAISVGAQEVALTLGTWQVIGPFKDEAFGNIDRTLAFEFAPERDALASRVDPSTIYRMQPFPGYLNLERRWERRPDFADGFYNLLPRGPAPSRTEADYLYRTLESEINQTVTAHLRMQDFFKVWLNGEEIYSYTNLHKCSRYPKPTPMKLKLKAGTNQLLIKNVSRWAEHGFSFGIEGMHRVRDPYHGGINTQSVTDAASAQAYLECFKFRAHPIPMFSPATLPIEQLISTQAASPAAVAYDAALHRLERETQAILAGPATDAQRVAQARKLEAFLDEAVRALPPILFVRKPLHYTNAIGPSFFNGSSPCAICLFDPAHPEAEPRVIFENPQMRIFDFNLSFDAQTLFFSANTLKTPEWHIYRIGIDGTGLTQLTFGASRNISPCPLPNGRIAYVSTQKGTFVECQSKGAGILYTMAADGSDIRLISANIDSDHTPSVMNDGRILFTRWDYGVEKNVFARHGLWSVNPDGTNLKLVYGNAVEDPGGFWNAQQIPGRHEIISVFGPHHNYHAGMLGLVFPDEGPEKPRGKGYRWITREVPGVGDMTYPDGYQNPYPLNEKQFIASYGGLAARPPKIKGAKRPPSRSAKEMRQYAPLKILYVDVYGNERVIYSAPNSLSCYHTRFLMARSVPPIVADRVPPNPWTYQDPEEMNRTDEDQPLPATMMVQDVRLGISKYLQPGEAKYIAVMEQVQKSRLLGGGEAWGHSPIIGRGTVHARRLIGLVPVERDGSAFFKVPALRSVSLNVLDANGKTLMRMGSDMHVMPGENVSCVGCHEQRELGYGAAPPALGQRLALQKPPVVPQKQGWGTQGLIDYPTVVQPVWDAHCIRCHSGPTPKGMVNLTDDKTRFFSQSYDQLIDRDIVDHLSVFSLDHDEGTPKSVGAYISRIDEFMSPAHCGTEIGWDERFRVYCWIDANVPYYATYDSVLVQGKSRGLGMRDAWHEKRSESTWANRDLLDVFDRRCAACHERNALNQSWLIPVRMKVYSDMWGDKALTSHGFGKKWTLVNKLGPEYRVNLTNPTHSLLLQAPLAKAAGGVGLPMNPDGSPVFKDRADPDYQKMLQAIETGKRRLYQDPRIDLLGREAFVGPVLAKKPVVAPVRYLVTSHKPSMLSIVDEQGAVLKQIAELNHPQDAVMLADGRIFCSELSGAKMFAPDGTLLWGYTVPEGCQNPVAQVLGPDRFLVGNEGPCRLLEINSNGETLKTIQLATNNEAHHGQFRFCRKTPQGTYLVPFTKEGVVKEFDAAGQVVRDFGAFDKPVSVCRVNGGNTLVGYQGFVTEFSAPGKPVWSLDLKKELGVSSVVTGLVRLENGNTLFGVYHAREDLPDFYEVTPTKKRVRAVILPTLNKVAAVQRIPSSGHVPAGSRKGL